ncbi:hypothetical protein [Methanoregula sp.]|uniref:hypothetical protein n=1 Tax=Methanoregula sp. TaxID=2052170 RepID=UPI00236F0AB0|nr:hypothetical protein [Methanoregula sp.]MDD1686881.1 hypothetical protein [Methanoregula sp.]
MPQLLRTLSILLLISVILFSGCTTIHEGKKTDGNLSQTPGVPAASYKATLNQPNAQSGYIKMDSDVYNIGEVVEFTVTNDGSGTLACAGNQPSFSVKFQTGNGKWATRMGTEQPNETEKSSLAFGNSTQVYRFVTEGWEPGRYRIVHDCGVEREILIRALPVSTPAPAACLTGNTTNTTPWITIDPPGDQYESRSFTLQGTTNLPAGQELDCAIFSVLPEDPDNALAREASFTTRVEEGSCGTNTWSASGEIQTTGEFFFWISDAGRNTTAIKRFTVLSV